MNQINEDISYQDFEDGLNDFTSMEDPKVVLLVASDSLLEKMVIAFRTIPISAPNFVYPVCPSVETMWRNLWDSVTYDVRDIQRRIGGNIRDLKRGMQQLISNRIIYPDGTINEYVSRYLEKQVDRVFEGKTFHLGKK